MRRACSGAVRQNEVQTKPGAARSLCESSICIAVTPRKNKKRQQTLPFLRYSSFVLTTELSVLE